MSVIELSGVRKAFGDEAALRGVDVRIDGGEIVLLMGPNGAGKSVLSACLSGATEPDDGTIELFGGCSPRDARGRTGLLLQGELADPKLTGRENLRFFERLHPAGTREWERLAERFEIDDDLDRLVGEYSGGMVQKIELLAALAADVPLYLLDEPATALDLATLRVLHDELLARRDDGKTVLLTSHTPLDAQIADRIVFLRDGRVVADGSPARLLEDLPDVVRIRNAVPDDQYFLGERSFRRGDEVRGFLRDGTDPDAIAAACSHRPDGGVNATVDLDQPSYTDLFNYFTYVDDAVADRPTPATAAVGGDAS